MTPLAATPQAAPGRPRLNIDAVRADRCVVARGIGQTRWAVGDFGTIL